MKKHNSAEAILKNYLSQGHEELEVSFHPTDIQLMVAAMTDYANQKQIPLSAFDKFIVSGPHLEENPFYTLRKTDLEGIINK